MRIRTHLLMLAIATVVPVLLFAMYLVVVLVEQERQTYAEGAIARLRSTMTAIDTQVLGQVSTLNALAASQDLIDANWSGFRAELVRAADSQPAWQSLYLAYPDGRLIIHTLVRNRDLATAPLMIDKATLRRAVASGKPAVGGVIWLPVARRNGLTLAMPISRHGSVGYVLAAVLDPESFAPLIEKQRLGEGWVSGLVDANGSFIARVPPAETPKASADFLAAVATAPEGWYRGETVEGTDSFTAHITSPLTNWSIGLGIPADVVQAGSIRVAWILSGGIVLAIGLALLFATGLGRRIMGPVRALAAAARGVSKGETTAPERWNIVTELRTVVDALNEAAAAVKDRQMLLEREKEVLLQADRAKDAFIAMLSHELRNPLAAMVTAVQVLDHVSPDSDMARHSRGVLNRQTRQMKRLIDDLLDLSRVVTGKAELRIETINLAAAAMVVVDTWRSAGRFGRHHVSSDMSAVWIRADRSRVEQILSNLLDNAVKFSPENSEIVVTVSREGDEALLRVADNGPGLPPELQSHVFGLFVQGEQGPARRAGGMGIGLALVKRLAEMQQGSVSAASAEGHGASFTVCFPAVAEPPAGAEVLSYARPGSSRRVIVVDDNADLRSMLAAALRMQGYEVHEAANGQAGLELADRVLPDVAVIDIGLADMDGYAVARQLRAKFERDICLVAFTGYGQPADRQRAIDSGFDEHLTKPASLEEITAAIEALFGAAGRVASRLK